MLFLAGLLYDRTGKLKTEKTSAISTQGRGGSPSGIIVLARGDLQQAIDQANPGDTIVLEAGATFIGNYSLPKKSGDDYITITSSALSSLPPDGVRVMPSDARAMPKLVTPNTNAAIWALDGAHHYRIVGIEITATGNVPPWNLVILGADQTDLSALPSDIEIDRVYIHSNPGVGCVRGIALNSKSTTVKNSYISGMTHSYLDAQAILGWNGPGPYKIINNYLEGSGENIMFGGSPANIQNLVPSDIEIRNNYFFKPLSWKEKHPTYAGKKWSVKNLFELKNAQRVLVDSNIFENSWIFSQAGFAVLFTPRAENGKMPWAVVKDIIFQNNIIRHAAGGMVILGQDDSSPQGQGAASNITIRNNLFEDIDGIKWGNPENIYGGRVFQIVSGGVNITLDHNTAFHTGGFLVTLSDPSSGLTITNNLSSNTGHFGIYGDGTANANTTMPRYFPDGVVLNNAFVGDVDGKYPKGNYFPKSLDDVQFSDRAAGDYRLLPSSPLKNAGTDGNDVGADLEAIGNATKGVIEGKSPGARLGRDTGQGSQRNR